MANVQARVLSLKAATRRSPSGAGGTRLASSGDLASREPAIVELIDVCEGVETGVLLCLLAEFFQRCCLSEFPELEQDSNPPSHTVKPAAALDHIQLRERYARQVLDAVCP